MNSRCSRCALLTSTTPGAAIAARRAISPGWFMPSSITAAAWCGRTREQRQRHADVVVEVARGGEGGLAAPGAKDRRDHLRHRGLAVAAGHGDQRQGEARAPCGREAAERDPRVGHLDAGQAGLGEAALGERGGGAGHPSPVEEVVGVEALAAQRHEQVAGTDGAGVAVDARDRRRGGADQARAGQRPCDLGQRRHRRSGRQGAGRGAPAQGGRGDGGIGEGPLHAADVLVVLVALAGDQDDVGRASAADGVIDRLGAVLEHVELVMADRADQDLRDDEVGGFEARVVAGDDGAVGEPAGDRRHQRALGGVAVAAAAEHAPEPAAALLGERTQRSQGLLEGVGRVGVVDDDFRAAGAGLDDALHPARHRRQRGAGARRLVEARAERAQRADHAQQVGDIELADQRHHDRRARRALVDAKGQAAIVVAKVARPQAGRTARRDRPDVDGAGRERGRELDALLVVEVDHRRLQPGPGEELRLGAPVGRHVAVVVEVVLA